MLFSLSSVASLHHRSQDFSAEQKSVRPSPSVSPKSPLFSAKQTKMSGAASQVPAGADPKIKEIMTSLDDDKIGEFFKFFGVGRRVVDYVPCWFTRLHELNASKAKNKLFLRIIKACCLTWLVFAVTPPKNIIAGASAIFTQSLIFLSCNNYYRIMWAISDMLAATSVLQHQATEVRSKKVNWQSYFQ